MNSPVLTGDGRYALGMSFAIEAIVPEMMAQVEAVAADAVTIALAPNAVAATSHCPHDALP